MIAGAGRNHHVRRSWAILLTANQQGSVVEKAIWKDEASRTTLFEPSQILRHSSSESAGKEKENGGRVSIQNPGSPAWIPATTTGSTDSLANLPLL
jgi:hypothetical protein